jgi:predicted RND superfamily exporter protein
MRKPFLQTLIFGFFTGLARVASQRPWLVLGLVSGLMVAVVPGLARLKLRTDGRALLSPGAPEVLYDRSIRETFGIEDQIVVLVDSRNPEGIFNPDTLQLVRDLTADLTRVPGFNPPDVISLATEPTFRFRPGTLVNQRLLEPPLKTAAELDQLREDLRRIELYTGTLVSADGKSTVILIGTPAGADRAKLYREVSRVIEDRQAALNAPVAGAAPPGPATAELGVTGAPVAESLLGIHILEDLGVPRKLLGAHTRTRADAAGWKLPRSFAEFRLLLAQRLGLVPVSILVMMLIFLISFRNLVAVLLPLPGIAATLVFVFGLMGWCGVPVYLTIAVTPVLLTATGVTNDIYLFSRYFMLLAERPEANHRHLVRETFENMVPPLASTSLTAGIGFLSFAFSPLGPVRAFGLFTGVGVLFGMVFSFTAVPALLALVNPRLLPGGVHSAFRTPHSALGQWLAALGRMVVRRRWWVVGLGLVVLAVSPDGLRRLAVQDSWTEGFSPESDMRRVTERVNAQFDGMHLLFVSFNARQGLTGEVAAADLGPAALILPGSLVEQESVLAGSTVTLSIPGTPPARGEAAQPRAIWRSHFETVSRRGDRLFCQLARKDTPTNFWSELAGAGRARFEIMVRTHADPRTIQRLADLAGFIRERRQYAVGGVLGPAEYLSTTRFMVRPSEQGSRRLPADANETKVLWDYYGLARSPRRLREVLDTNWWQSLTTVFLKDANFADTARLMRDLRDYEAAHLAPEGIKLGFAGDVALSQSLIRGIVSTQITSLFWSLLGIWLVTAVLGGSWRWGLFCVLPSALAVLVKFAVMGWVGMPLGVATSMFAAMTLGIGVNCAIQLLETFRHAQAGGQSATEALSRALALTGPPALVNTVAVSLGFGVLMLSQVPANARLGFLVVLGLVECFVASLALLPVLLYWWPLNRQAPEAADAPGTLACFSRNK